MDGFRGDILLAHGWVVEFLEKRTVDPACILRLVERMPWTSEWRAPLVPCGQASLSAAPFAFFVNLPRFVGPAVEDFRMAAPGAMGATQVDTSGEEDSALDQLRAAGRGGWWQTSGGV